LFFAIFGFFFKNLTKRWVKNWVAIELMCNGTFEDKNHDEAIEYLDLLVENAQN